DTTPADQMIDACTKIVALKVFKGEQLAAVYFWRAVGWNKKGDYARVIADATDAIRLQPSQAVNKPRGSAYYDKGDYELALADINQAIRLDPTLPQPLINRTAIWRARGDLDRAIADGSEAIRLAKEKPPVNIMTPPNSVLISGYTHRALAYEAKGDYASAR